MIYRECFQCLSQIERKRITTAPNVMMRLNRGERPEMLPLDIRNAVATSIMKKVGALQQYPSYSEFYTKLSKFLHVPVEQIVVGAGIEEFIRTLMFMCCEPGEGAAVLWPTCAMYDIYARAFGVDLLPLVAKPGTQMHWSQVVARVLGQRGSRHRVRVLFLPNPGQPVDTCYSTEDIAQMACVLGQRDILLVVDEAHYGFGAPSALRLVNDYSNLLVMRTFSKFYGAASIRVGYVVGQERVIKPINAVRPSGEIAGPSMAIASMLLDKHDELVVSATVTAMARDWLVDQLSKLGVRAYGRWGFSVLVEFPSPHVAERMGRDLAEAGMYVKTGFPPPLGSCMLLACGSLDLMERFYVRFEYCWREVCVGAAAV